MILRLLSRSTTRRGFWLRMAGLLAFLGVLIALPHLVYPPVATDILAWALFAVSLDLAFGVAGMLSFGHAAFWGVSAYATGLSAIHLSFPFPLAILSGAVAAAIIAIPIGYFSTRTSGIYLTMVTLAFAQLLYYLANQWGSLTGGENGLQGIPKQFLGINWSVSINFYYAALPIVLIVLLFAWRVIHSPFGRAVQGIRDNPRRAASLGFSVQKHQVAVFVISAFLAGIAGGVGAVSHGFASLKDLNWTTSGEVIVMTVLGGIGTFWGPILGATILVLLRDWLATSGVEATGLVTGIVIVLVLLLFRKGIVGTVIDLTGRIAKRRRAVGGTGRASPREDPGDRGSKAQESQESVEVVDE